MPNTFEITADEADMIMSWLNWLDMAYFDRAGSPSESECDELYYRLYRFYKGQLPEPKNETSTDA